MNGLLYPNPEKTQRQGMSLGQQGCMPTCLRLHRRGEWRREQPTEEKSWTNSSQDTRAASRNNISTSKTICVCRTQTICETVCFFSRRNEKSPSSTQNYLPQEKARRVCTWSPETLLRQSCRGKRPALHQRWHLHFILWSNWEVFTDLKRAGCNARAGWTRGSDLKLTPFRTGLKFWFFKLFLARMVFQ